MAQTLSTLVQNTLSDPTIGNNAKVTGAQPKLLRDTVTVPDTANNDTVILAPISVDAIVELMDLTVTDLGSAGTIDVGLFRPLFSGDTVSFTVVDQDCIATGLVVAENNSAALAPQRFNGLSSDSIGKRLWEIAGLSAKPAYPLFYIGLTTTTGTTTAGTATVICSYTI